MDAQDGSSSVNLTALLKQLTAEQLDFVRERLATGTDAEAAAIVGVAPETVSRWKARGAPIDDVIRQAKMDSIELARESLRRLATRAVEVLSEEMGGKRKLEAAKEVLNRVGLEPGSKLDVTTAGKELDFGGLREHLQRKLDAFIDEGGTG